MHAVNLTDFVNRNDVRMIERRSGLGFTDKAAHPVFIFSKFLWQNFQSDFTVEFGVLSQIHLAHPARAELRADFVATEFCASSERHHLVSLNQHCVAGMATARERQRVSVPGVSKVVDQISGNKFTSPSSI